MHKRPRDSQHGDINPDPPATAQLQHAITWKPYGLVPFLGYSTPQACLGVRRTSLTTKQHQDEIACDHKEIPYSDSNLPFNARVNRNLRSSFKLSSSRGIRIDAPVLSVSWSFEDHSVIIQALRKGLIEHEASDTGGVPRWKSSCPDRLAEATGYKKTRAILYRQATRLILEREQHHA